MATDKIIYLNGNFLPLREAYISVMDRGFLFADGIYEVIPVYNHKLFRINEHLQRLQNSLNAIHIQAPCSDEELTEICRQLLKQNPDNGPNQVIYIQITRGADTKRHHNIPTHLKPTLFIQSSPLPHHEHDTLIQGKKAVVLDDIRWGRCDIKSIALLPNILLNNEAKQQGCEEAILIRDGMVTEGASSNVFIVENNRIITPPLSQYILGGITRDMIIELAQKHNIPLSEQPISKAQLFAADEVWISSSTREIFPITDLDGRMVGNGTAGPVWHVMIDHLHQFIATL